MRYITVTILSATLEDVAFIDEDVLPSHLWPLVQNQKTGDDLMRTKIKTIKGVKVVNIRRELLSKFCVNNGVKPKHPVKPAQFTKQQMCERIELYIDNAEEAKKTALPPDEEAKKDDKSAAINRIRMINVLFCDDIRPHLHERASNLTKDEMTQGFRNGQQFWTMFVDEYNNREKHNDIEHEHVMLTGRNHPSNFQPITWQTAKEKFGEIWKDYEYIFSRWKQSGTHMEMETLVVDKAFSCFTKSAVLLYMHEFVAQHPNVFATAVGHLPAEVFMESINMGKSDESVTSSATKKKRSDAADYNVIISKQHDRIERQHAVSSLLPLGRDVKEKKAALDEAEFRLRKRIKRSDRTHIKEMLGSDYDSDDKEDAIDQRLRHHLKMAVIKKGEDDLESDDDDCYREINEYRLAKSDLADSIAILREAKKRTGMLRNVTNTE